MKFVLDTNSISVLANYYPEAFPSLWAELEQLVDDGTVLSVREVYNELKGMFRAPFLQAWAKEHRPMFLKPVDAETLVVQEILAIPHFQMIISKKALMKGSPVADPFIVASAVVHDATVITEESFRKNAAKVPNICERFDVPSNNLQWFMDQQGWSF